MSAFYIARQKRASISTLAVFFIIILFGKVIKISLVTVAMERTTSIINGASVSRLMIFPFQSDKNN
ncbi:hypothetical protein, partial [Pantoea sp. R102]|uniref:hypothetical protein n=1 Tax=Pantoea sp. R102 TaxID=2507583 RepID=UPI001B3C98D5